MLLNWSVPYSIFRLASSLKLDPVSRDMACKLELTVLAENVHEWDGWSLVCCVELLTTLEAAKPALMAARHGSNDFCFPPRLAFQLPVHLMYHDMA
jgi:hypothetical protein